MVKLFRSYTPHSQGTSAIRFRVCRWTTMTPIQSVHPGWQRWRRLTGQATEAATDPPSQRSPTTPSGRLLRREASSSPPPRPRPDSRGLNAEWTLCSPALSSRHTGTKPLHDQWVSNFQQHKRVEKRIKGQDFSFFSWGWENIVNTLHSKELPGSECRLQALPALASVDCFRPWITSKSDRVGLTPWGPVQLSPGRMHLSFSFFFNANIFSIIISFTE